MIVFCLEEEAWRREALATAFEERAGAAVKLLLGSHVADVMESVQKSPDVICFPLSLCCRESEVGEILAWYIERKLSDSELWLHGDTSQTKNAWLTSLDYHSFTTPTGRGSYREWVDNLCDRRKVKYQLPTKPLQWWGSRPWLINNGKDDLLTSFGVEDTDLAADLASFFKFKGSQLASRLGGDSWVSWHLESEGKREVFRSAKEDHTVYVREEAATKEKLEERHVTLLKTLGLNDGD